MKPFRVILDTSFLMESTLDMCWRAGLSKLYQLNHETLVVPKKVIDELNKIQSNTDDTLKQNRARNALLWLNQSQDQKITELFASSHDPKYNDHLIVNIFLRNITEKHLILVTQDEDLAKDVLLINRMRSFNKKEIFVFKFNENIEVVSFHLNQNLNENLYKNDKQIEVKLNQEHIKMNQKLYDYLIRNKIYTP